MPVTIPELDSNCLGNSYIKLGDDPEKAPRLRYSVPQKSAFTAYGHFMLEIGPRYFRKVASSVPNLDANVDNIEQTILNQSYFPGQSSFINNAGILNLATVKSVNHANITVQATKKYIMTTGITNLNANADTNNNNSLSKVIEADNGEALFPEAYEGDGSNTGNQNEVPPLIPSTNTVAQTLFIKHLANQISVGFAPVVAPSMGNFTADVVFIQRPIKRTNPTLFIVEEYKTVSYLGDYGAGQTLSTFTLLPGEKTTITVKTFKEITSTSNRSDSVIDSFSQSSASELENTLEEESTMQATDADTSAIATAKTKSKSASVDVSASGSFLGITAKASAHADIASTSSTSNNISSSSARSTNVGNLAKASAKQTESANSNRNVEINTSTQDSYTESVETSVVRELINVNQSRVLNFVFRQLLQEYITITYLDNIKIAFSNGHPESFRIVPIQELDILLSEVIKDDQELEEDEVLEEGEILLDYHSEVFQKIVAEYYTPNPAPDLGAVVNYESYGFNLLKEVTTHPLGKADTTETSIYYIKDNLLENEYQGIKVPEIILNVDTHILRTNSVIADALLGQGEALDCFNAHSQEAKKQALYIENQKNLMALEIIADLPTAAERAEAYIKMFNPPTSNGTTTTP